MSLEEEIKKEINEGNIKAAEKLAATALEKTGSAEAWKCLGIVQATRGDMGCARQSFKKVFELTGETNIQF